MGDILGSIFGTSSSTEQEVVPDAIQRAMNALRYGELANLFSQGSINQFSAYNPEGIYSPTDETRDLIQGGVRQGIDNLSNINYDNLMSLDDYRSSFNPVTQAYESSLANLADSTQQGMNTNEANYLRSLGTNRENINNALGRSYSDYTNTRGEADAAYQRGTNDVNTAYNAAIARGDFDLARTLATNEGYANRALGTNESIFNRNLGLLDSATSSGLDRNKENYLRSLGIADTDAQRSLTTQDANRARALELGIGTTGNYVDQIATPRLNAALTLQGLESGGAVPAAIARATAEQAMPYLQSIENVYGTNQANTLNSLTQLKGTLGGQNAALDAEQIRALLAGKVQLGGQYAGLQSGVNSQLLAQQGGATEAAAAGNRALGSQRLGTQGTLASGYQNNLAQLAQALMANNVTLEQAGISADSALGQQIMQAQTALRGQQQQGITSAGNTYGSNATSFAQSLPGASQALSMLPGQMEALRAGTLSALQPLADYPRQLREADYLRRQGLFTTAFTGIPYSPGSTTYGGSATGNIFDQLGGTIQSGLTGGGNIGGANT